MIYKLTELVCPICEIPLVKRDFGIFTHECPKCNFLGFLNMAFKRKDD